MFILCDYFDHSLPELPWGVDRVLKYIGFYAVGHFLQQRDIVDWQRKVPKVWMAAIAVILLVINLFLSYAGLTTGVMWFITALIGVAAVWIIAILINRNRALQYFGRISLVILCVHGPVYRVIVKLVSLIARMSTNAVRENFILVMPVVVLTLLVCAAVYEVVIKVAPWIIGKSKSDPTRRIPI